MRIFYILIAFCMSSTTSLADIRADVRELFTRDMGTLDFARTKIEVGRMIDPSIDVDAQLAQIDQMVATTRTMLPPNATSWDKVEIIRRYIHQAGAWNDGRALLDTLIIDRNPATGEITVQVQEDVSPRSRQTLENQKTKAADIARKIEAANPGVTAIGESFPCK